MYMKGVTTSFHCIPLMNPTIWGCTQMMSKLWHSSCSNFLHRSSWTWIIPNWERESRVFCLPSFWSLSLNLPASLLMFLRRTVTWSVLKVWQPLEPSFSAAMPFFTAVSLTPCAFGSWYSVVETMPEWLLTERMGACLSCQSQLDSTKKLWEIA